MKKYLFLALAAFGFAACTTDDLGGNNGPIHSGEVEESYIAINLSAADITRAEGDEDEDEDVYLDGTAIERRVATAHFFFFKNGEAFPVNVVTENNNNTVSGPGTGVNYLAATLNFGSNTGSAPNVSDISNVVLLLKNYKGEYPNQIVAVLNWTPEEKAYSLADLHAAMTDLTITYHVNDQDERFFVMSNSVYLAGNNIMDYTPLSVENIFDNEDAATDHPVQIYVERVAAKVTVTVDSKNITVDQNSNRVVRFKLAPEGSTSGTGWVMVGTTPTPTQVYARILGWELHNDIPQSYLLKNISDTWTEDYLGFPWNSSSYHRSYWATSIEFDEDFDNDRVLNEKDKSFQMSYDDYTDLGFANQYGFNIGDIDDVATSDFTPGSYAYVGENTNPRYTDTDGKVINPCTKIILKARLENEAGTALEIASWMGQQYVGNEALRTAIANSLKYTLFYKEGNNYIGIKPEDLVCVAGGNGDYAAQIPDNNSYVQLSSVNLNGDKPGDQKEWYKLVNGEYVPVAAEVVNTDPNSIKATNKYLATNVQPSVLYANGETFYYIDIRHLGATADKTGYYGIVRNHIYNVTVNKIGGYGSPVYVGYSNLVVPEYPEDPTQEGSFVSAQVNILAWRLVNQTVDIQPQQ